MVLHSLCIPSDRILSKVFLLRELHFLFVPITAQCKWNRGQTLSRRASGDIVLLSSPLGELHFVHFVQRTHDDSDADIGTQSIPP